VNNDPETISQPFEPSWTHLFALMVLVCGIGAWRLPAILDQPHSSVLIAGSRIDPNSAPWYELASLPQLGRVLAKRIVTYRESMQPGSSELDGISLPANRRVFDSPVALLHIHGIGPQTVAKIAPYLRFDH